MNKVSKQLVDELIDISRQSQENYTKEIRNTAMEISEEISKELTGNKYLKWAEVLHFFESFVSFRPEITNDELYRALTIAGIEFKEENA